MVRVPWAPLTICGAVALVHHPVVHAGVPPVFDERREGAHLALEGCPAPIESGDGPESLTTPKGASPFSCRAPQQSPLLDTRPPPEWWGKLTLPDVPIERPWEVDSALVRLLASPKRRGLLRDAIRRSGATAPYVVSALAARRLPRALVALPLLESGYLETARSRVGAVGLWQLMPNTARRLGLFVSPGYDERRNPERATDAAIEHLARLHAKLGSWDLALAAYSRGEPGLRRALKRSSVSDFWSLADLAALPEETRAYVPTFLALSIIYDNAELFGLDGPRDAPRAVATIDIPEGTPLALIARAAGTSILNLRHVSPELVAGDAIPKLPNPRVSIPATGLSRARVMLPTLLAAGLDELTASAASDFDWGRDEIAPVDPGPTAPRWDLEGSTHESR